MAKTVFFFICGFPSGSSQFLDTLQWTVASSYEEEGLLDQLQKCKSQETGACLIAVPALV